MEDMAREKAPFRRYTDQDLRQNPTLEEIAFEYASTYGGDFEPVVIARREIIATGALTLQRSRIVLNCMRNDYEVAYMLPEPQAPRRPVLERARQKAGLYVVPDIKERVVYSVRPDLKLYPAEVTKPFVPKVPFFTTRTGKNIHFVDMESDKHFSIWGREGKKRSTADADGQVRRVLKGVSVRSICKHAGPSRNSILLDLDGLEAALTEVREGGMQNLPFRELCKHCIAVRDSANQAE